MRRGRGRRLDGWLVVDKPAGMTSAAVVNRVRSAFAAAKAGHGGTLDPLATGVLPVAFGAATKTVPFVMDGAKRYRFTLRWGDARDTDDADGRVIAVSEVRPDEAKIRGVLDEFRGAIMQVPPTFSAVKIGGARAYDLARSGEPPVLQARPAWVAQFDLIGCTDADHSDFEVVSGKGVYMRSLARDLARRLGTFGHVAALRRLSVGPFTIAQAIPLDKICMREDRSPASPDLLLPIMTALADIPAVALTEGEAASLLRGQALSLVPLMGRLPEHADPDRGLVQVLVEGEVLGFGRLSEGFLKPERLLMQRGETDVDHR
ncbi:MAG: tRNA pseudouridine(55) synthase TruB [Acetobacteraceae bacterium]